MTNRHATNMYRQKIGNRRGHQMATNLTFQYDREADILYQSASRTGERGTGHSNSLIIS